MSDEYERAAKEFMREVFDKIAHGDDQHRRWLSDELRTFEDRLVELLREKR